MENANGEARNESTFFFPLRANAGYFDSPNDSLFLMERIKQASLLYDRLVFEKGEFMAIVSERGFFEVRDRNRGLDSDSLVDRETFEPTGGEALVEFSTDETQFVPFLSGPVI